MRPRASFAILAALLAATFALACQRSEPKPLGERLLEKAIQRCKSMVRKSAQAECEDLDGDTIRDAINGLHRTMVEHVRADFRSDAVCWKHGPYLVCDVEMRDGPSRNSLYRLSSRDDGSDSQVLSLWSQEW